MSYIKHNSNTKELKEILNKFYKTDLTNIKIERAAEDQSDVIEKVYKDIAYSLAHTVASKCKRAIKEKTESYINSKEYKKEKRKTKKTELPDYSKKINGYLNDKLDSEWLNNSDFLEDLVKKLFEEPEIPPVKPIEDNVVDCFEKILWEVEELVRKKFPEQPIKLNEKTFLDYLVMDSYIHVSNVFSVNKRYVDKATFIKNTSYEKLNPRSINKKARILKDIPTIDKLFLKTSEVKFTKRNKPGREKEKYFFDMSLAELNIFLLETAHLNPYRDPLRVYLSSAYCRKCEYHNSKIKCKQCHHKHSSDSTGNFISEYIRFVSWLQDASTKVLCDKDNPIVKKAVYYYFLNRVFDFENLLYITNKIIDVNESVFENLLIKTMSLCILIQDPYGKQKFVDEMFEILKAEKKPKFGYKNLLKDKGVLSTFGANRSIMAEDFYDKLTHCRECIMYNSTTITPYMTACFYILANQVYGNELAKKCEEYIILRQEYFLHVNLRSKDETIIANATSKQKNEEKEDASVCTSVEEKTEEKQDKSVFTHFPEQGLSERQKIILYKLYELIRKNTYNTNNYKSVKQITSLINGFTRLYSAEYLNTVTAKRTFAFSNDSMENPASTFQYEAETINEILENIF